MSESIELTARIVVKDGEFTFANFDGQEFKIDVERNQLKKVMSEDKILEFVKKMLNRSMMDALVLSNLFGGQRKK